MSRFGPSRGELRLRLWISLGGLALMGVAVASHGLPKGPAFFEVILVAGAFFGGTAVWTLRKLMRGDHSDGL